MFKDTLSSRQYTRISVCLPGADRLLPAGRAVCRQASPGTVPPELRPQLELMGSVCRRLSERLMTALDAALGSGHQLLTSCHQRQLQPGGWSVLRLLHYPPVTGDTAGSQHITGCGAHTDFSTLTLLFQHGVRGLQVSSESRHV